jgi:hypothetical protein
MGPVRTIGLLFFLTILVGGCILAKTAPPSPETVAREATEISWEKAIDYRCGSLCEPLIGLSM